MATDKNSNDISSSAESSAEKPSAIATKVAKAPKADASPVVEAPAVTRGLPLWALLVLILVAGCCAVLAYFGWQWQLQQTQQSSLLRQQMQQQSQQLVSTQQQLVQIQDSGDSNAEQWTQSLNGLEQRVEQHSRRLRSLSTTTRDDWLLAEAEYLLRLANQRMQMERSSTGALALLRSADQILLELDDADLFPVRDKLQRDITALKLAPSVDRSGLYLQLAALADAVVSLPEVPVIERVTPKVGDVQTTTADELSFWQQLKHNFWAAMGQLKDQVRIRHHDKPLEPLLPPDGARYLRQNLRFNLEQAQLAMLREESEIYQHSIEKAEKMLRQYFATQDRAQRIADELALLKVRNIIVELPSISGSLAALQEFTARLHLLDERAGRAQLEEPSSTPAKKAQ